MSSEPLSTLWKDTSFGEVIVLKNSMEIPTESHWSLKHSEDMACSRGINVFILDFYCKQLLLRQRQNAFSSCQEVRIPYNEILKLCLVRTGKDILQIYRCRGVPKMCRLALPEWRKGDPSQRAWCCIACGSWGLTDVDCSLCCFHLWLDFPALISPDIPNSSLIIPVPFSPNWLWRTSIHLGFH
jgi:hypothetical protein